MYAFLKEKNKDVVRRYIKMQKDLYKRILTDDMAIDMIFANIDQAMTIEKENREKEIEKKQKSIWGDQYNNMK